MAVVTHHKVIILFESVVVSFYIIYVNGRGAIFHYGRCITLGNGRSR